MNFLRMVQKVQKEIHAGLSAQKSAQAGSAFGSSSGLSTQTFVLLLSAIVLVFAFSLNLGEIIDKEREVRSSPEVKQQEVLEFLEKDEKRTELAVQTEAKSPSLDKVTGQGEAITLSGTGAPANEILLKKPDGPESPAWVEYSITYAHKPYLSASVLMYGKAAKTENGRYFTLNFRDTFVIDDSVKEPYTRTGSFWLAGEADVPVRLSGLGPGDKWTITIRSAADAPVLRPGDTLSSRSGQGVQAFRYIADRPTKVEAITHQPLGKEETDRFHWANSSLQVMWIDSDDQHENLVSEQTVLSLASNHVRSQLSQSAYEGSTELLPGDYLMSTQALGEDWQLSFTDSDPTMEGQPPAYALNPLEPIDDLSGETGLAEGDFLALKVIPAGPRLMHFSAEGPQVADTFSLYVPSARMGLNQSSSASYDDVNGVILVPEDRVKSQIELRASTPWKIKTYSLDALPTYRPGDRLSGTGPMLFYLEPGQEVTARLERVNNGDDRGRSRLRIYTAEGTVDSRSPSEWLELYTTSLSSTSIEVKLQPTDEPTLFYFDISATVSWKLALEGR